MIDTQPYNANDTSPFFCQKVSAKYHRSIIFTYFCAKYSVPKANFIHSIAQNSKVPIFTTSFWALAARIAGNECPLLVQSMPEACSLCARGLVNHLAKKRSLTI